MCAATGSADVRAVAHAGIDSAVHAGWPYSGVLWRPSWVRTVVAMMKNMAMVSMVMRDGLVRSRGTTAVERTAGAGAPAAGTLFVGVASPLEGAVWAVAASDAVLMASSRVSPRSSSWSSSPPPPSSSWSSPSSPPPVGRGERGDGGGAAVDAAVDASVKADVGADVDASCNSGVGAGVNAGVGADAGGAGVGAVVGGLLV